MSPPRSIPATSLPDRRCPGTAGDGTHPRVPNSGRRPGVAALPVSKPAARRTSPPTSASYRRQHICTTKGTTMTAPVPATRAGRCDCCTTPYRAGTPIIWDSVVSGWVLAGHRSAGSRR